MTAYVAQLDKSTDTQAVGRLKHHHDHYNMS